MITIPNSTLPPPTTAAAAQPQQLPPEIRDAAKQFEAVFLSQMLSHMFSGIEADPVFGGGPGENMFRSMMIEQYGKQMAYGQGIGISDQLQKTILQMQQR